MKRLLFFPIISLALLFLCISCEEKSSKSSSDAIAEMLKESSHQKSVANSMKHETSELSKAEQSLREEREAATEELRYAREEAAAARAEAAEARAEAQRAREAAAEARTGSANVSVPGSRLAYVIREGGYTNARSGPGTSYSVMNKVKDGSPILYIGSLSSGWVEVYSLDGRYLGYMSSRKIVP